MTAPDGTDVMKHGATLVRAEVDKWLADCPRPYCTNAMKVERWQDLFVCEGPHSCGAIGDLVWPADPDAIEALLMMRPVPITRIWLPHETLEDLLAENVAHDCVPPEWVALAEAAPGGALTLCDVQDQRVTGGLLYQQLEAAGKRREIGGQ